MILNTNQENERKYVLKANPDGSFTLPTRLVNEMHLMGPAFIEKNNKLYMRNVSTISRQRKEIINSDPDISMYHVLSNNIESSFCYNIPDQWMDDDLIMIRKKHDEALKTIPMYTLAKFNNNNVLILPDSLNIYIREDMSLTIFVEEDEFHRCEESYREYIKEWENAKKFAYMEHDISVRHEEEDIFANI